jgi:hypothetical protein
MTMSNHSAKFVSAIFASILAGTSFATVPESGAKTADNCLSGPKGAIPAGHHWYYRVEQPSKRQCWYSRAETDKAESGKTAGTAAPDSTSPPPSQAASSSAATDPAPPPSLLARKSIADARAELTAPQIRVEDTSVTADPRAGAAAPAASLLNSPSATAPDVAPSSSSSVASRWPDSSGVSSASDNPRLAAAEPPANPQPTAATAQKPAVTPVALAAADSSLERQSASMQMLLLVMAGALALAGITASLVFRFARANAPSPEIRGDRRAPWDHIRTERSSPAIFPDEDMPIQRVHMPRNAPQDPRAPDDPERRVTEMLARLARSAQT